MHFHLIRGVISVTPLFCLFTNRDKTGTAGTGGPAADAFHAETAGGSGLTGDAGVAYNNREENRNTANGGYAR